jgi:hypothetical protein
MRQILWKNFVTSVWVLIGFCAVNTVQILGQAEAVHAAYGPFGARVMLWPIAIGAIELMLWFRPFRHRQPGARLMAGFMALVLLMRPVFVALIVSDLYEREVNWLAWWIYMYVAVSHLGFAFAGRR